MRTTLSENDSKQNSLEVLIVGGGGREHALAWKVAASLQVAHVYVAPGNAGTAVEPGVSNVDIGADDIDGLLAFAREKSIALTIIGPEVPLVAGIVDRFAKYQCPCFGPTQGAAQLEGSKAFTKSFLMRHEIPTAAYCAFDDFDAARRYIRAQGAPIVIKADGLAAGKGVVVASTVGEAVEAARGMLEDGDFADAGKTIVVEEFLAGEEASFMCVVDGEHFLPLATSQDHKARDNGDVGPNTGGMGAYSPAPVVTDTVYERIIKRIIEPTIKGMAADGFPYTGFLYAGVMIDAEQNPKVLEYNCRFGDPETQPVLMRLKSDLVEICTAALAGRLEEVRVAWDPRNALGVVMTAGGYPDKYRTGHVIEGLSQANTPDVISDEVNSDQNTPEQVASEHDQTIKVFHAGTALKDDSIVTSGGRVLCVTALGDAIDVAQRRAYEGVKQITWQDCYHRTDIGHRAVARLNKPC